MRKIIFAIILSFLFGACGSSVTDISKDILLGDISFLDTGTVKDYSEPADTITDCIVCDFGQNTDVGITDESANDVLLTDSETEDAETDAPVLPDAISEDITGDFLSFDGGTDDIIVDASEDVVNTDAGTDGGADVYEDAGSGYCTLGDKRDYKCPDGELIDYCVCENRGCKPRCDKIGTESEGWYDCSGQLIKWDFCAKCSAYCGALGSKSEGWYSDCSGLIKWDQCAPDWFCLESPESRCGLPCTDSCDCPKEKPFCINGHCDNSAVISCSSDNMCPCGSYCMKSFCVEGTEKCYTSCDCKQGYICVNNVCKEKLSSDCSNEPCPCNSYCAKNPFGVDTCQKGCLDNCDCPSAAPICSGGMCISELIFDCKGDDRNCPCNQICIYGKCVKSDELCGNSCECLNPLRQVCINNVCTDGISGCSNDSECPCGMTCIKGNCYSADACRNSCDCKEKEICRSGKCEPYDSNAGCKTDTDCPCNQVCASGVCIISEPLPCKYSCDCPKNMICKSGTCEQYVVYKCLNDNDCLCGNYCDLSSGNVGYCTSGCNDPCDCPAEKPYCVKGQCQTGGIIPVACKTDSDCRCREVCKGGECLPIK